MEIKQKEAKLREQIIIETARKLFQHQDYLNTSIDEVCKACGFAKGTFYLSFNSKEELLCGVAASIYEEILESLQKLKLSKVDPLKNLTKIIDTLIKLAEDNMPDFALITSIDAFLTTLERNRQISSLKMTKDEIINFLSKEIRKGQLFGMIKRELEPYTASQILLEFTLSFINLTYLSALTNNTLAMKKQLKSQFSIAVKLMLSNL